MNARLAAEQALQDSETSLSSALEARALMLFEWDLRTGVLQWTLGAEARLGLEPGSIGDFESWSRQIVPEDVDRIKQALDTATACRAQGFAFRYRIRQRDGLVRSIDGAARCFYDDAGTAIRASGVNIDVTAPQDRHTAFHDRDAQLLAIVPDAMVAIDKHGLIRRFSATAERLFGYRAGEMIGKNVAVLTPDAVRARLEFYLERYRHSRGFNGVHVDYELTAARRDGSEFPVQLSAGEMVIDNERLLIGFIRDLSELDAAKRTAADLRNELAQVGRVAAMGEMAGSLAHELNQPLSATANFLAATALLIDRDGEADRAKIAEMVALANEQIQRAGHIIRNIREFIIKRDVEIGIEPIEKTVRDSVSLVLVGAARADIDVRYAFDQAAAYMFADRVQIQQVLVNLLRNASEALQGEPRHRRTILIAVRSLPADMIEISVSDTGPGIEERVLQRLFRPLASTKGKEGMGLGLSICRRIIESHAGTLTAENRMAGGATFRFTLPAGSHGGGDARM